VAAFLVRMVLPALVKRFSAERVLAYSFLIGAAGFLLVPFFESMIMLSLVSFFFGIGMGCGQPLTLMMTFSHSVQGRSGEAMGLRLTINYLTRVVGQVLFGAIGSAFGLFPVFLGNALLLASGWAASHPRVFARRRKNP
jgi:MFS family permease